MSKAAGRYGDLRIRSKSFKRAQMAQETTLVFLIQICSIILPIRVVAFLLPRYPTAKRQWHIDYATAARVGTR